MNISVKQVRGVAIKTTQPGPEVIKLFFAQLS